jgi:tRNA(fMet)-specific endonuclease VapC
MPRFMLDSDTFIYIAKHDPPGARARFARLGQGEMVISVVAYGELYFGAMRSNQRERAVAYLDEMVQGIAVESLSSSVGQRYGEIRATLEKQGRQIGNNDLWIGAHAMALNVTLVTNNEREFSRIAGLRLENWTK